MEETCCRLTPVSWVCPPPQVPSLLQQRQGLGPQPPHGRLFLGTDSSTRWSPGPYSQPGGEDDPARPWVGTRSCGLLGSLCFVCKGVLAVSSGRGIPAVSQPQRRRKRDLVCEQTGRGVERADPPAGCMSPADLSIPLSSRPLIPAQAGPPRRAPKQAAQPSPMAHRREHRKKGMVGLGHRSRGWRQAA